MKVTLTIKKEKKRLIWGHVFFMENLLIAYGRTVEEVKEKLQDSLQNYYEIMPHTFHFFVATQHIVKAQRLVDRLKKKKAEKEVEVTFNSRYFT